MLKSIHPVLSDPSLIERQGSAMNSGHNNYLLSPPPNTLMNIIFCSPIPLPLIRIIITQLPSYVYLPPLLMNPSSAYHDNNPTLSLAFEHKKFIMCCLVIYIRGPVLTQWLVIHRARVRLQKKL